MNSIWRNLNPQQLKAATTTEGPVRVLAGAGTGKTKVLASRYSYLVNELAISPANILCVTFTRDATREMHNRIRCLVGDNDNSLVCTFHGFCAQVLKTDSRKINWPKAFDIADERKVESVLRKVYADCGFTTEDLSFREAMDIISREKHSGDEYVQLMAATDDSELTNLYDNAEGIENLVYYGYLYEQRKSYTLDFDDLILLPLHVFHSHPEVLEKWQNKLDYIMVDEFQDVNSEQYELCKLLAGEKRNLFVVGDPDQTIYEWRGAGIKYLLGFEKDFPEAQTIVLKLNYRSTPEIIAVANSLIEKNTQRIKKDLVPTRASADSVVYCHCKNSEEEAAWITDTISDNHEAGIEYRDMAVLYRASFVSRAIEEALREAHIPYRTSGGVDFYERKEVKTFLAYLRMLIDGDDLSFKSTINEPKRGFGPKKIEVLEEYQKAYGGTLYEALKACIEGPMFKKTRAKDYVEVIEKYSIAVDDMEVSDLAKGLLSDTGYEEDLKTRREDSRLENLAELTQSIASYEEAAQGDFKLSDYLDRITAFTEIEEKEEKNAVRLMTVHSAKGLEFPVVFVAGMSEGIFPSSKADTLEKLEEERRLAYVAFTRAKDNLYLSDNEGNGYATPSRFIFDVDEGLIEYLVELDDDLIRSTLKKAKRDEAMACLSCTFSVGDSVEHKVLGKGFVTAVDIQNSCYEVYFEDLKQSKHVSINSNVLS